MSAPSDRDLEDAAAVLTDLQHAHARLFAITGRNPGHQELETAYHLTRLATREAATWLLKHAAPRAHLRAVRRSERTAK